LNSGDDEPWLVSCITSRLWASSTVLVIAIVLVLVQLVSGRCVA
jgi:hypothetical protein